MTYFYGPERLLEYEERPDGYVFSSHHSNAVFVIFKFDWAEIRKDIQYSDDAGVGEPERIAWEFATLQEPFKTFFKDLPASDYQLVKLIDILERPDYPDTALFALEIIFKNHADAMLFKLKFY